jgi:hypothetical protein
VSVSKRPASEYHSSIPKSTSGTQAAYTDARIKLDGHGDYPDGGSGHICHGGGDYTCPNGGGSYICHGGSDYTCPDGGGSYICHGGGDYICPVRASDLRVTAVEGAATEAPCQTMCWRRIRGTIDDDLPNWYGKCDVGARQADKGTESECNGSTHVNGQW